MKNIKKKTLSVLVSSVLATTSFFSVAEQSIDDRTANPNVIFIYLDDAGYADISANAGMFKTPNIDKLANGGVNFSSFYASSPVCSPSRAGLLTGRLGNKTGMYGTNTPVLFEFSPNGLPQEEVTIADMLRENGYSTLMLGKWHLGVGKDGVEHSPTRHGFDEWLGIPTSNDMYFTNPNWQNEYIMTEIANGNLKKVMPYIMERESAIADENGWGDQDAFQVPVYHSYYNDGAYKDNQIGIMQQADFTTLLTDRAVDYIEENKASPFFMYIPYPQNHVPLFVSEGFKNKTNIPYGDVMTEIDYSVGRIIDQLEDQDILENTVIIFSSDNGPWLRYEHLGASGSALPYRDGKNATYEGGTRVPGIIYWEGSIPPQKSDEIVSTLDMLPTIATLTGSQLPEVELDGYDVSPLLKNGEESPRDYMPYWYMNRLQAYRSGEWKVHFVKSDLMGSTILDKPELYNLVEDESESKDLANTHPEQLDKILKEVEEYKARIGEPVPSLFDL